MAIQVWDGTKYVGAELGRFGPSGTLKEALIWDGTKYVKVWPSSPYPLSGTVVTGTSGATVVFNHTAVESGTFAVTASSTGGSSPWAELMLLKDGAIESRSGAAANPAITHSFTVSAGQVLELRAFPDGRALTVTWSLAKN